MGGPASLCTAAYDVSEDVGRYLRMIDQGLDFDVAGVVDAEAFLQNAAKIGVGVFRFWPSGLLKTVQIIVVISAELL